MEAPGKGILKITSILFIILGALAALFSIIGLVGSLALTALSATVTELNAVTAAAGGILIVASIVGAVLGIVELIVGILGLKKSADPTKHNFFVVIGIILCALQLISMIISFSVFGLIGFVLPVLYIVGGLQNKKAVSAPAAQA